MGGWVGGGVGGRLLGGCGWAGLRLMVVVVWFKCGLVFTLMVVVFMVGGCVVMIRLVRLFDTGLVRGVKSGIG